MNGIVTNSGHARPVRPRWNVESLVGVGLQNAHSQVMYSQCSTRHLPDSCHTGMACGLWWGEAPTLKGEPVKETSLGLMDLNAQVADSRATPPFSTAPPSMGLDVVEVRPHRRSRLRKQRCTADGPDVDRDLCGRLVLGPCRAQARALKTVDHSGAGGSAAHGTRAR